MMNILIADDEKIEREGIRYLLALEKGERRIFEAANGKQAMQILRTENIDMILTDIKMPVMDGLELARRAKELFPEIRIVIFSGYNDFTFAQEAIRYGVTDYILKPVDPDNFHEIIEKAEKNIRERQAEENREIRRQNFLQQY
ncbi:MAG TPA: response regulator, partial [Candidatus Blautia excrementigallinarum]|nr:response regulator [Candidatus Blautia excrementigallinarum]